jgi:hypothetical protein
MRSRWFRVLPVAVGGLVHFLISMGAFGVHDVAIRATITGTATALAGLIFAGLMKHPNRAGKGERV